ncbi:Fpg/Nei family DNA glycosylase [Amycolatopsis saalfeldensis]|uniref:Formamidopyrimidine-DNA glycosylase n=1 Tax=Amycolatopsis saalfeldensis TaxID=394193 RepID=A0A1H8PR74_9PSEU|nr:DNA-formamidopyrimidine glycosylase family protein [Amycolatopsis saalfeldensis]SEO44276.1 formamidopyrimidine-DNA glycosylase [Amycolatopsis saalfeldensis]
MPELPEVESARSVIERAALGRRIVEVDDSDTYVCRPHRPGEIRSALTGRLLVAAHRRGKTLWCDTGDNDTGDNGAGDAPVLGLHLGMSGKIVIAGADGSEVDGGDYWEGRRVKGDYRWSRFALTFDDGSRLMLVDPRRLGRIGLDPEIDRLGPDAATVTPAAFRAAVATGTVAVKARLLDQHAIAGIGNLLADEILWRARINPARPVDELTPSEIDRLLRATRRSVAAALAHGGVHTLTVIPFRRPGARCPRDHAPMSRGKVGGRTTWWCSAEQPVPAK